MPKTSFRSSFRLQRHCRHLLLLTIAALAAPPLHAQFTWNTASGTWSTDLNWTPVGVPLSDPATQLIFPATSSYTTTNDIGAGTFELNRITVNNTGTGTVTITGASTANTLTFGGGNPTLDITGNTLFTGLLAGTSTITKAGPGTFIHDSSNTGFTGTIIIDQGVFINRATSNPVTNFNPVSIVVNSGATYQFGAAGAGDPNLPNTTYVTVNTGGNVSWQEGEVFGGFHLQGGTITMQANSTSSGGTPQIWTSGTLTGGNFVVQGNTAINKTTQGTVFVAGNLSLNTGSGRLNILDGTISLANAPNLGTTGVTMGDSGGGTSGTLAYQGASATKLGDFTVNAGGGIINVERPTTVLTLSGNFDGPGNFSKTGPGRLHLAGLLNGTGTITAGAGVMQVEPVTTASSFVVAGGAVLSVNTGAGLTGLSTPSINLASEAGGLQFDLNTNALIINPLATITNLDGLVLNGPTTLSLANLQPFANGTYTLLDYTGAPISSGFNLALPGRTLGALIYDTANSQINVSISGTDTLKWSGAVSSTWDVGTAAGVGGTNNWRLITGGSATNFINTDSITFDDTATRFDVTLVAVVQPNSAVVNATANYTFTGPGKLSGPTALTKSGSGTLSLATDNDYIGGTTVDSGTLQLGNGGTTGSIVGTITINGGTLAFNRSDLYTFPNTVVVGGPTALIQNGLGTVTITTPLPIAANTVDFSGSGNLNLGGVVSGTGILNKSGTGALTLLANNNTFTGTLNVNAGTVLLEDLGIGGDLGATSIVVNSSGTFILGPSGNSDLPNPTVATVNSGGLFRLEQGENFGGFILNGGEFRFVSSGRTGVNLNAIAPFDGAVVYDLRSGAITTDFTAGGGGALNQGGNATNPVFGVLSKTTSGTVTVSGAVTFQGSLALQIREGTLAVGAANFPATGAASITLGGALTNGTLEMNSAASVSTGRPFILDAGGGTISVLDGNVSAVVLGSVSGPGSLTKTGSGTLVLTGANTYTGGTVIINGSLEANNFSESATGSGPVTVSGTLSGDGVIITGPGNDVSINGIFQPGATGAFLGSDFSITAGTAGETVFGATSTARFDLWTSTGTDQSADQAAADRLLVSGDLQIDAGSILRLTNPNILSFRSGDVFRLLDWTGVGVRTGTWTLDFSDLNLGNLTVDATNLYTAGTIAIVPVPEPNSILLASLGMTSCILRRRRRLA